MNEFKQIENEILNILEILKHHISLEKNHLTYDYLLKLHDPKTLDEFKNIKDIILRELEYRKTQAAWREARSKYNGFYWSHYQKDEPIELYLTASGVLVYEVQSEDKD